MAIKIKAILELTVSESSLEDALAEYDELTVEGLLQEVLDKVKEVLGEYELPRRIMARKAFQRTTSGKVIRTE